MSAGLLTRVEDVRMWFLRYARCEVMAKTAERVAAELGFGDEAALRRFIRERYDEFPEPIAGCGRGLFVITRDDPLAADSATHYDRSLGSRAAETLRRRRAFRASLFDLGFRRSGGNWIAPPREMLF